MNNQIPKLLINKKYQATNIIKKSDSVIEYHFKNINSAPEEIKFQTGRYFPQNKDDRNLGFIFKNMQLKFLY